MSILMKYSYPIVFGTFVLAVSTTFIFRYFRMMKYSIDGHD